MNLQFSPFINQTILQKNEINSTDLICFDTASSSELNSLIQNLLNFRNDEKIFLEALRTKCDDSLISCG